MNSKISDDTMPSGRNVIGVSNSRTKSSADKLTEKEDSFDSGIISSAEISQTFSTEVDSLCDKLRRHPSSPSLTRKNKTSEQLNSKDQQMGQSGLDTTDSGVYSECLSEEIDTKSTERRTSSSREDLLREMFTQDEDGDTQLHLAIIRNDTRAVEGMLKIIPSPDYVNIRNYHWQTCLHLSVLMDSPGVTRLLLLAGAKIDVEDRNGNSPLHLACKCNHVECVTALLNPLNIIEEKYMHNAFQYKPIVTRSIEYLNEYNYDGVSCLHLAAEHEDRQILSHLLMYGADVNISECKGGYTLLHEAVESGDVNLVRFILTHREIDVNRENYARRTAYQLASRYPNIRKLLFDNGSQVFNSEDEDSETDSEKSDDDDYCYTVS